VVEVVWNPFVGFNVDERITEASPPMWLCDDCMEIADNFVRWSAAGPRLHSRIGTNGFELAKTSIDLSPELSVITIIPTY
jgi:hypothetical protein